MLTTPVHFRIGRRVGGIEAREAVAGKQRPVDLLLAILPAAPARDGRQEGVDVLALELLADDLLVARARPDGEPAVGGLVNVGSSACPTQRFGAGFSPVCGRLGLRRRQLRDLLRTAFFTSSFFHSMIACARSFARNFCELGLALCS